MSLETQRVPELTIHLFGAPRIHLADGVNVKLPAKTKALLFYLVVTKQTHLRTSLASLLWGEMSEKNARASLRKAIQQLRSMLPDHLNVQQQSVGLKNHEEVWVDVAEFEERIDQSAIEEVIELYSGDFLAGFFVRNAPEFDTWQLSQQVRLRESMLELLQVSANRLIAQNKIEQAIRNIRRIVELEPWREEAHRQLMQLLAQNGQRSAALNQYELCRQTLWAELAVEPSAATQELYARLKEEVNTDRANTKQDFVTSTDYTLLGREAEWEILRRRWQNLAQPHFICIAGEAGIGKTRLAEELFMLAEREGQQIARTRSHALEGRLAYAPVADWLRSIPVKRDLSKLDDVWLTEIARLLPELLAEHPDLPHPAPIRESWQRKRLFEALAHAFTHNEGKLLLVLDDLQWCDGETLEWLHYMLESTSKPLLIVGTLRSEEIEQDHALHRIRQQLHRLERCDDVALEALTPGATEMLAGQVAANSNKLSNVLESVYADTAGNPLFVIETVRAASSNGESDYLKSTDLMSTNQSAFSMPPKMYRVIQSRLMRLSADSAKLAQVAASIGREFDVTLLVQAAESSTESVLISLDELWQQRIVREVDGIHYDFSHDRIRDVAYAEIRPIHRQLIHKKIVQALEAVYDSNSDDVAGELAKHCHQAKMLEKSLGYYQQAADGAKELYAFQEVAHYLEEALAVADAIPTDANITETILDLLYQLGSARIVTHDFGSEPVTKAWDRAYTLSKKLKEPFYLCRSLSGVSMYSRNHGEWRKARKYDEEALALLPEIKELALTSQVLKNYGACLYHMGEPVEAFNYFDKALRMEENSYGGGNSYEWVNYSKRIPKVGVLIRRAKALALTGYLDTARLHLAEALQLEKNLSEIERDFASLDFSAMLFSFLLDVPRVKELGRSLLIMNSKRDFPFYERAGHMFVAWADAHSGGDAKRCAQTVRESVDGHRNLGIRMFEPYWRGLLAETLALSGEYEEALSEANDGLAFANECGNTYYNAQLLKQMGDYQAVLSAPSETVESHYQQAIDVARQQQAKLLELRTTTSLSRLWQEQGKINEAHQLLANTYGWFTEGFDTIDLQDAKALLDQLNSAQNRFQI